jgi:hypothetical protein
MMGTTARVAARAEGLVRRYGSGPAGVTALDGVSIDIRAGSFTAVMGPSGSAECTRELGLLRAVGMRRGQLGLMIAGESLIVGGIGAALGTALVLGLGAALAAAFTRSQQLTVAIPAGQIVIYAFAAAFTGVLAAIGPAHRAARMNMLAAVTTE